VAGKTGSSAFVKFNGLVTSSGGHFGRLWPQEDDALIQLLGFFENCINLKTIFDLKNLLKDYIYTFSMVR